MKTAISENELQNLLNFIGYGSLEADVWFLGYEEAGGGEQGLQKRLDFDQVEDLPTVCKTLDVSPRQFAQASLPGTWEGMCEVMLRLDGKKPRTANIQKYLVDRLGQAGDSTLLCSLLPLPVSAGAWAYGELIPAYATLSDYYSAVKPARLELYRQLVGEYHPKLIIAYGRPVWPDYQELFRDYNLSPGNEFLIGWDANTVIILCDHFSELASQGRYDELITLILENCLNIDTNRHGGQPVTSQAELARRQKDAARQATAAKRKSSAKHDPSDPYCVCAYCLGYESD